MHETGRILRGALATALLCALAAGAAAQDARSGKKLYCWEENGRIVEQNFDTFNSMRIAQMPKVESIVMPTGGAVWGGIGEPTICVAAPAVLNAFFRATNRRIRSFPLKNHGIELV